MNPTANAALTLDKEKKVNAGHRLDISIKNIGNYFCKLSLGFNCIKEIQLFTPHYLHVETLSTNSNVTSAYHLTCLYERTITNNNYALYYSFFKSKILRRIVNIFLRISVLPLNTQKKVNRNNISTSQQVEIQDKTVLG